MNVSGTSGDGNNSLVPLLYELARYRKDRNFRDGDVIQWDTNLVLQTAADLVANVRRLDQQNVQIVQQLKVMQTDFTKTPWFQAAQENAFLKGKYKGYSDALTEFNAQRKADTTQTQGVMMEIVSAQNLANERIDKFTTGVEGVYKQALTVQDKTYDRVSAGYEREIMKLDREIEDKNATIARLEAKNDELTRMLFEERGRQPKLVQDPFADKHIEVLQTNSTTIFQTVQKEKEALQVKFDKLEEKYIQQAADIEKMRGMNEVLNARLKEVQDELNNIPQSEPAPQVVQSPMFKTRGVNHDNYIFVSEDITRVQYDLQPNTEEFFMMYPWFGVLTRTGTATFVHYFANGSFWKVRVGTKKAEKSEFPKNYDTLLMFQN